MANELKNCPFCHKTSFLKVEPFFEPSFDGYYGFTVVCSAAGFDNTERGCGAAGAWGETEDDAATTWNTRPAAPVEGLSVAFYQVFLQGAWIDCPLSAYTVYSENGEETRKLCDHAQAEAIIAAKEEALINEEADHTSSLEERDRYHDIADKLAQAIADRYRTDIGEHSNINDPWQNALDLIEADNAALTARVKAQIEHIATLDSNLEAMEKRAQEGETQLAAARKALSVMLSEYDELELLYDEPASMVSAVEAARAALEAKP